MEKIIQCLFYNFLLYSLASCSPRIYYGPEAGDWQTQALPDTAALLYTVYLLGDAGAPKSEPLEPIFRLLKSQLARDSSSTLVVLGDNLYHDGLSEKGAPGRETDEQRLNEQVKLVANHQGKVFFVPGNHDWDYMGPKGLEKIRRQEQYIEAGIGKGNTFVPDNGCPGPFSVNLHKEVVLIAIDSHWWLHRHEKPYGSESGCQATNEDQMLQQVEEVLEANRGRHVVAAAHHPFISNSNHGGYYSVLDHLFPLRLVRDGLYIPLPVLGSLYPFYRKYGGVDQDIPHFRYQQLIKALSRLFTRYGNVVYAAGHDHNLQLHKLNNFTHIISGSGCKTNHVDGGNNATFIHQEKGFVKLLYYNNGEAWAEFWSPEGNGSAGNVYYRSKLYDNKLNGAEAVCYQVQRPDTVLAAAAGSLQPGTHSFASFLLRADYRREWHTPVRQQFLPLGNHGRALTVFGISSQHDNPMLRLRSSAGFEYSFRPLLRNPLKTVPVAYRGAGVTELLQETWIPSQHPYAPLVVSQLEKASGLLTLLPNLYIMPDAACLEPYREPFRLRLGYLEPDAEDYHTQELPNREQPVRVISYNILIQELERDHQHQPDRRTFARVRLLDMLVGDWDRHEGQYSWAVLEQREGARYLPIPADRDNAFFYFSGIIPWLTNRAWGARELQHFGYTINDVKALNNAARNLDRRLLSTLTVQDWESIADSLQAALTDEALLQAARQMPPEIFRIQGETLVARLHARREKLREVARQYAKLLATYVDVYGSEKQERFEVKRLPDGATHVTVYAGSSPTAAGTALYSRTFSPTETKEIRLYGLGGNDIFHVSGTGGSSILVRVIGHRGVGRYQYLYTQRKEESRYSLENTISDKQVVDNTAEYEADFASGDLIRSPASDRFFYNKFGPAAGMFFNQNDGLFLGAGAAFRGYKFRSQPYGMEHQLLLQHAFATGTTRLFHQSEYKNTFFDLDLLSTAWAYLPDYSMWFRGYGNTRQQADALPPARRVAFQNVHVSEVLQKPFGSFFAIGGGGLYEYYHLSESRSGWVQELLPPQENNLFNQRHYLGATGYFKTNVKDNEHNPMRGLVINLQASLLQGLGQDAGNYRRYQYEVRYYMSPSLPFQLTFAGRLGGTITRGNFGFYQAAMLGGGTLPDFTQNIRGLYHDRLIGDRSIYTNLELRASLFHYRLYLFPGKVGVLALYDSGRVFAEVHNGGSWHKTAGGGAWVALFNKVVLSGTVAKSAGGAYINIQNGFFF